MDLKAKNSNPTFPNLFANLFPLFFRQLPALFREFPLLFSDRVGISETKSNPVK